MSYTKDITIWCDYCPQWVQPNPRDFTIAQARKTVRGAGWVVIQGEDVCPKCVMDAA